ncbi:hypothetical protein GCM10019017_08230 [Streptomyces showdoensis]
MVAAADPAVAVAAAVGGSGRSSRKSALGTWKRQPVTAVEKSRMRSVVPGGSPRNMWESISSVTAGVRA